MTWASVHRSGKVHREDRSRPVEYRRRRAELRGADELEIAGEEQRRRRVRAVVVTALERMELREHAAGREPEHRTEIRGAALVGRAVQIAVDGLYDRRLRADAVGRS